MKVLCDQMLGTLAKWLRILGFDTYFAKQETTDDELIEIAKKEKRILITRDKELVFRAKRENIKIIELKSKILDEQLKISLKILKPSEKDCLTRCLICNNILENIDKKEVKNKVPNVVFDNNNNNFLFCNYCNKVYWQGTHVDNMLKKINQLI